MKDEPKLGNGENDLWREDVGHFGIRQDNMIHNENVRKGHVLCKNCGGTGNQLYSMYQKCEVCKGTGIAKKKKGTKV